MKLFISKNNECIIISNYGKKFRIEKNEDLFDELSKLSKEEIKQWYIRRKGV